MYLRAFMGCTLILANVASSQHVSPKDSTVKSDTLRWYFVTTERRPMAGLTVRTNDGHGHSATFVTDKTGLVTVG